MSQKKVISSKEKSKDNNNDKLLKLVDEAPNNIESHEENQTHTFKGENVKTFFYILKKKLLIQFQILILI